MNEQKEYSAGKQSAGSRAGAEKCSNPMNYCCLARPSPSLASSGCSDSDVDKAKEPATLSSRANSATRWCHDISSSSKTSSTTRSRSHDNVSFSSQSPLDYSYSSNSQKPASLLNPLLTWTAEELELVSQMRQGMKNTSRRKRAKKPKDAPKRPLRWAIIGMIVDVFLSRLPCSHKCSCPFVTHSSLFAITTLYAVLTIYSSRKNGRKSWVMSINP